MDVLFARFVVGYNRCRMDVLFARFVVVKLRWYMDVLFARFVRVVMCSIEMTYGRAICAICAICSGSKRDFIWTCYLRNL